MAYTFSGHETFSCRHYWLKKGLDHAWSGKSFGDQAIIELGVGKNMVRSIRYWVKSFGLLETDEIQTKIAELIFSDKKGMDPYLEDVGSIWLLHYLLVTNEIASIYSLIFNHFRKQKVEFEAVQILQFLKDKCRSEGVNFNENSLKRDIGVFLNNYTLSPKPKSIEDEFSGLLYELNLIERSYKHGSTQYYRIETKERKSIPAEIILCCILMKLDGSSISFHELLNGINQVGSVFATSSDTLHEKIEEITSKYHKEIVYSDDGGIQVLQFKKELDPLTILKKYYGN